MFILQWHITHACNLRCVHCYQKDYRSHMPASELFAALDRFDEFLREKNLPGQINLTGGEPLAHPSFFTLAQAIKDRGYRLGVLTNGTLIDDECAGRLAALKPVFVQVSLDGTEKIHDAVRGEGSFRQALSGIDALKKHGVKVLVSFTAQKGNYRDFGPLARVCRRHRVDKLWWDRVVTDTPEDTACLALTTEQFRYLVHLSGRLRRFCRLPGGKRFVSTSRALQALDCPKEPQYECSAGKNLLIFLADGGIMPCRRLPFVIGNVKDGKLSETIAKSETMKILAVNRVPHECARCEHVRYCRGGSKCVTYAQTGELLRRDVNCFYCKNS